MKPRLHCRHFCSNSKASFVNYLRSGRIVSELKQIHSVLLKTITNPYLLNHYLTRFLTRLLRSPNHNLSYAHQLFDQIPNCKNQFAWTSLIRLNVFHRNFRQSISLYSRMHRAGVVPSQFTFSSVLNACARLPALCEGKQVHASVVQMGSLGNKIVQTALLDMYAKCGLVLDAWKVFSTIDEKDIVASTAMICGYTKMGMMDNARRLFDNMEERNTASWATMVAGYANGGDMKSARELYDAMPEVDFISMVAVIAGYAKCGDVEEARKIFDSVLPQHSSCWAAMVACYSQNGYAKEAIEMYRKMKEEKVSIHEVAMVGAISACSQLGDAETAKTLAQHVEEGYCDRTVIVSNSLIHMYSKCGSIDQSWKEFKRMNVKDVISYSSMMTALADHGKTIEALNLFSQMQEEGIKPNQVSFIGVLNACSIAGRIEDGFKYFEQMTRVFGMRASKEHYACLVHLLAKSGLVEKAYELIMENLDGNDAKIWGCLVEACKVYGNAELGKIAAEHLVEVEPGNGGNYVVLANAYAAMGRWDDAERVRSVMFERGMRKDSGCSWIL